MKSYGSIPRAFRMGKKLSLYVFLYCSRYSGAYGTRQTEDFSAVGRKYSILYAVIIRYCKFSDSSISSSYVAPVSAKPFFL